MKKIFLSVFVLLSLKSIAQVSYMTDPYANRRSNYDVIILRERERQRQNSYVPPVNLELMERVLTKKDNEMKYRINELQSRINRIAELIDLIPQNLVISSNLEYSYSTSIEQLNRSNISDYNTYLKYLNHFDYLIRYAKQLINRR